jgi:hypothetical protein
MRMIREDSKTTSALFEELFKAPDLDGFLAVNADHVNLFSFHIYLQELCARMGQVPERVIKQSSIERTYGHQLFNGTRRPSRDKVIQLAFGFGLDVEGTQKLLHAALKPPLYPRIKRDAAILYGISRHMSVMDVQNLLHDLELSLLGGE